MTLQLNDQKEHYRPFTGKILEQTPILLSDGRVAMPAYELMKRRLEVLESNDEDLIKSWWHNDFDTADTIFQPAHNHDEFHVVPNNQVTIRELRPGLVCRHNSTFLGLNSDYYRAPRTQYINGHGFSIYDPRTKEAVKFHKNKLSGLLGVSLKKRQAKKHPVLRVLALEDRTLLNDYVDAAFDVYKLCQGLKFTIPEYQPWSCSEKRCYWSNKPEGVVHLVSVKATNDIYVANLTGTTMYQGWIGNLVGILKETPVESAMKELDSIVEEDKKSRIKEVLNRLLLR